MADKLLVLVSNYRTKDNPYANTFVHTRVKAYLNHGIETCVYVLNTKKNEEEYEIDGVHVITGKKNTLARMLSSSEYSKICVHFIDENMIDVFKLVEGQLNITVVVHGDEALHWYDRVFPGVFRSPRLLLATLHGIVVKTKRLKIIKDFFRTSKHNIQFVAVSNWMKDEAEKTWDCKDRYKWNIIPNPIDSERFAYIPKTNDDRFKMLSIRPFANGKYANDITAQVLIDLSKEDIFKSMNMTWVGEGLLYKRTVRPVEKFDNVLLINKMLPQEEIPEFHRQSGIMICPTRQDAQGVSMCEAMSSGLVPITLYNTAIPEYLPSDKRLICNSAKDMKMLILRLVNNPEEFKELSKLCSEFIREKCSFENTTLKEIELFQ